jgi:hypothetical protein
MIELAPLNNREEHLEYCHAAGISFEEGAVGFKIFDEDEKVGICQLKFLEKTVYVLNLSVICDRIPMSALSNSFSNIVDFLHKMGVSSIVFPVQNFSDSQVAQQNGFDKISETLYVFDFLEAK